MRSQYVIWFAIVQHLMWGVMLLFSTEPTKVTAIYTTYALIHNQYLLAGMFIVVGLFSLFTMRRETPESYDLWASMPQQFLLMASATGAVQAVVAGHFGDGAVYSRWFIAPDQSPAILLAVLHTLCLIRVFAPDAWTQTKKRWEKHWSKQWTKP